MGKNTSDNLVVKSKKEKIILLVILVVGVVFVFLGILELKNEEKLASYSTYKYSFDGAMLDSFDYNNLEDFDGIYGCDGNDCEKLYSDYKFYTLGESARRYKDTHLKYVLFVKNDKKYFFWDVDSNKKVSNNVSVLKDTNSKTGYCNAFKETFEIEKNFECDITDEFFELYIESTRRLYVVDKYENIVEVRYEGGPDYEKKVFSGYGFDGAYAYYEFEVSGLNGSDLGLKNNRLRSRDGYFYIQWAADSEGTEKYYVVSLEKKEVKLLKDITR